MPGGERVSGAGDKKGDTPSPWLWVFHQVWHSRCEGAGAFGPLTAVQQACAKQIPMDL